MEFPVIIHNQDELNYIAQSIAFQIRVADQTMTDQHHLGSLPIEEQKRLARIELSQMKTKRGRK